jgi:hypothetical protein
MVLPAMQSIVRNAAQAARLLTMRISDEPHPEEVRAPKQAACWHKVDTLMSAVRLLTILSQTSRGLPRWNDRMRAISKVT